MSFANGVPTPYHHSTIALPNTGALAARQLDLTAINTANCPSNLPAFESEKRVLAGSGKVGLVWICFSNNIADDADPGSGALIDLTANRFALQAPKLDFLDPDSRQYMTVFDPDADNVFEVSHRF